MKQDDVKIGMQARVKIGQRLAEVTVIREIDVGGYKSRRRFECRTADTGRTIKATAARLRPMPAPAPAVRAMVDQMLERREAERQAEREAAWQRGRQASIEAELAAWAVQPVGAW